MTVGTPPTHGWENSEQGFMPLMYQGPTSAELTDGLFCECEGGTACDQCLCFLNGLPCINLCNCDGDIETCYNEKTLFANNANTD